MPGIASHEASLTRRPEAYGTRLAGKVAIVTGAGSQGVSVGTGRAIAILFAGEGARVCLVDQDRGRAEETCRLVAEAGGDGFVSTGDVTSDVDCRRFAREAIERCGAIDVLVNNVGTAGVPGGLDTFDEAAWTRTIEVNLKSALLTARHVVPHMRANGAGSIVNVSSIAGVRAHGSLAYGPSKAAMEQLSRELAILYGRDGIRANTVAPGHIHTPFVADLLPEEARDTRRRIGPLGIEGDGWDVAYAALFLASDEARFITGQQIVVDGGVSHVPPMVALELVDRSRDGGPVRT